MVRGYAAHDPRLRVVNSASHKKNTVAYVGKRKETWHLPVYTVYPVNQKNNNDIFFNPIDIGDNTIPNGNAMMLINLVRLGKMKEAKILSDSLNGYLNIYKNHMMTAVRALDYFNNINSGKKCTEQGCNIDEAKN